MGTITFADGSTMPLESFRGLTDVNVVYLRVRSKLGDLSIFEDESKTKSMLCAADGMQYTFIGYTHIIDIIPEGTLIRVGMRK